MASIKIKNRTMASASTECQAAYDAFAAALEAVKKTRADLHAAFQKTEHFNALTLLLNGYGKFPGRDWSWVEDGAVAYARAGSTDLCIEADTRQAYADPKTINMLLSGKLLTDAEKRKLLKAHGIFGDEEAA